MVVSPHPDDEVLGCGGSIAKHSRKGDDVYLCIATKAYAPDWSEEFIRNRPKEIEDSNKPLGVKETRLLEFPTVKLDTIPQKTIVDSIYSVVKAVKPEVVYIPHRGDLNKDHRLIFESSLVALRPSSSKVRKILSYEVLSETEWGQTLGAFVPNVFVDISETFALKIEAMKAYKSEIRQYPHPRSLRAIETHARKRGAEIGVEFAEAFELIRELA